MACVIFGGAWAARWWYDSTLDTDSFLLTKTGAPRKDQSKVTIVLPQSWETNDTPNIDDASMSRLLHINNDDLKEFLHEQQQIIQVQKKNAKEQTPIILHQHLSEAFHDCQTRGVEQFASWYFSYTTTYRLLSIAMKSAAKHVISIGRHQEKTLEEAVTQDLQCYICEKYQAIVLRPAVTDPKVHRALVATLEKTHEKVYRPAMMQLENAMQQHVQCHEIETVQIVGGISNNHPSKPTYHIPPGSVTLELDWNSQLQKAQHLPVAYEKNPPELSLALIGGSAVVGKVAGGTAIKAVSAKLAAPFAVKAVGTTLGGKAVAGAAGGMVAGGPLGGAMGAAIGVGMDMAVNKGVSLMQRSAFVKDVRESLDATQLEWEERMLPEVDRVVQEEWFGHLESMLKVKNEND
ncbi:hypothetical protein IV203_015536 [Nitzschia inconspicua]|uniref:Uncharacterized protein n=1 Tax=Nitzschia inconspicua TaxID=303405 RepID=A0A9K3PTC2_9STRA|nr:hypothetical protein IV203_015536 [Nitzschia inconspicua]